MGSALQVWYLAALVAVQILADDGRGGGGGGDGDGGDAEECWEKGGGGGSGGGGGDDRRPKLVFTIPETTRLHAAPGETYAASFQLTKTTFDAYSVNLNYREERGNFARGRNVTYVEIIGKWEPHVIPSMEYNETRNLSVTFRVPTYAAVGRRFQIGMDALLYRTDNFEDDDDGDGGGAYDDYDEVEPGGAKRTSIVETDFFFVVSNGSLSALDPDEPLCPNASTEVAYVGMEWCRNVTEQQPENCTEWCWSARMAVRDAWSGVRSVGLTGRDRDGGNASLSVGWEEGKEEELTVGTRELVPLRLVSSCCRTSLRVEVEDVAGNVARCSVGEVESAAATGGDAGAERIFLVLLLAMTVVQ